MINREVVKKHGFYLEIDSLFDTRLATLQAIDAQKAEALLMSGYYNRERDDFPGFDVNEFRERYKQRDIKTLMNSKMTSLLYHLKGNISSYLVQNTMEGIDPEVQIILNVYPYKLTKEIEDEFVKCLKIRSGGMVEIKVINAPTSSLHPEWLKDNVVAFYCYDWSDWLDKQQTELMKSRLDDVVLMAPKIFPLSHAEGEKQLANYDEEMKDNPEYQKVKNSTELDGLTPFEFIESICKTVGIGFMFIETREFCIVLPDNVPTPPGQFQY